MVNDPPRYDRSVRRKSPTGPSELLKITSNEKPSRMKVSSSIFAESPMDLDAMINEHDQIIGEYPSKYNEISWDEMIIPDFSYFDLKIKIAENLLEKCVLIC